MKLKDVLNFFSFTKTEDAKPDVEYEFVERQLDDEITVVGTRILSGKYEGVIFLTSPVKFEEKPDGQIAMNYQFNVVKKPDGLEIDDSEFGKIVGDIIVHRIVVESKNNE